jgi:hypothetical protein
MIDDNNIGWLEYDLECEAEEEAKSGDTREKGE